MLEKKKTEEFPDQEKGIYISLLGGSQGVYPISFFVLWF